MSLTQVQINIIDIHYLSRNIAKIVHYQEVQHIFALGGRPILYLSEITKKLYELALLQNVSPLHLLNKFELV